MNGRQIFETGVVIPWECTCARTKTTRDERSKKTLSQYCGDILEHLLIKIKVLKAQYESVNKEQLIIELDPRERLRHTAK